MGANTQGSTLIAAQPPRKAYVSQYGNNSHLIDVRGGARKMKVPQMTQQQKDLQLVRSIDTDPVCPIYGCFGSADPQVLGALKE